MEKKKTKQNFGDEVATRRDLEIWGGKISLDMKDFKREIRGELKDFKGEIRGDMKEFKKDIGEIVISAIQEGMKDVVERMDGIVESRTHDLLGVSHDEIVSIQDKSNNNEVRIEKLEKRIGVR